jgi:hypothetical protein
MVNISNIHHPVSSGTQFFKKIPERATLSNIIYVPYSNSHYKSAQQDTGRWYRYLVV